MTKELWMFVEGNTINIQVKPGYVYDARNITRIGNEDDAPGISSAWAWINHLREKNWWSYPNEEKFIRLAEKICLKKE